MSCFPFSCSSFNNSSLYERQSAFYIFESFAGIILNFPNKHKSFGNYLTYASAKKNSLKQFKILVFFKFLYRNQIWRNSKSLGDHGNSQWHVTTQEIICADPSQNMVIVNGMQ